MIYVFRHNHLLLDARHRHRLLPDHGLAVCHADGVARLPIRQGHGLRLLGVPLLCHHHHACPRAVGLLRAHLHRHHETG